MNIAELYNTDAQDVFDIQSKVVVFITKLMSHQALRDNWQSIRNDIAMQQQMIDDEFERWNYYLFYLAEEEAMNDLPLKYKIEHDTISSRKIVISATEYRENDFDKLIKRYIQYSFEDDELKDMDDFRMSPEVKELINRE